MTEAELQTAVIQLAKLRGFMVFHAWISVRSEAGFPDLFLLREDRTLFRELKSTTGKVSQAQQRWLDMLRTSGHDTGVWRPADLKSGLISSQLAPAWSDA